MKKKYLLRAHFSMELGSEVVVGPLEIELDSDQAKANAHKLEEIQEEKKKKKEE